MVLNKAYIPAGSIFYHGDDKTPVLNERDYLYITTSKDAAESYAGDACVDSGTSMKNATVVTYRTNSPLSIPTDRVYIELAKRCGLIQHTDYEDIIEAIDDSGLGEWEFWCELTNNRVNANILESYDAYYNNYNDGDEYVVNKHALSKLDEVEGRNLCESITMLTEISTVDAKQKFYGDIPEDFFNSVIQSTNCKNGNMSPIAKYILNGYKEKGANKCGSLVTFFRDALDYMKNYPDLVNELNKFVNNQPEFFDVITKINELEEVVDERYTKNMLGREIVTVMDTPHKVLAPLTFEASRSMYGGRTNWCTAKHEDDFNDYCNEYSWIFIVDDHYQLQFDIDNGIVSFRDDCDDEIIEDIKYLEKAYIDDRWVENEELTSWYKHYCDVHGCEYGSDSLWDFLLDDCDYESFHSGAFVWDYKAIFIDHFGQEAYDEIESSVESIIEQGEQLKETSKDTYETR